MSASEFALCAVCQHPVKIIARSDQRHRHVAHHYTKGTMILCPGSGVSLPKPANAK